MINPGDLKSMPKPDKGCCKQLSICFMEKVKNEKEALLLVRFLNHRKTAQVHEATCVSLVGIRMQMVPTTYISLVHQKNKNKERKKN